MVQAEFRWHNATIAEMDETSTEGTVQIHRFGVFADHPTLETGVTQRLGGVSEGPYGSLNLGLHVGDDPAKVMENRIRLCETVGFDLDRMVVPQQVHQGTVTLVEGSHAGRGARSQEDALTATDALVTGEDNILLTVMLADCVPVVIFDPVNRVVAVAHAGWGGTVKHVTTNAVSTMINTFGSSPAQLLAAIGPAIGPDSYEVRDDVIAQANAAFPEEGVIQVRDDGSHTFDLWKANHLQLRGSGIPDSQIEIAAVDTYTSTDLYFSDRRIRPCGRFMCFAGLRHSG